MYRMCVCVMLPRQISASSPRSPPVAPWNTAPCPTAAASPWVSWRWPGWPPMKERQFQQHRSQHLQHLRHPAIISRLIWSAQSRCGFSKSKDKCVFFLWIFLIFQVALATSNYTSTRHELAIEHVAELKPRTSHGRLILWVSWLDVLPSGNLT